MVRLNHPAPAYPEIPRPYKGAAGIFGDEARRNSPKSGLSGFFGVAELLPLSAHLARFGPAFLERYEERAAILEFDSHLPRPEAEAAALGLALRHFQTEPRPRQDRPQTANPTPSLSGVPTMSLTITASPTANFKPAPAGTWIARCFRVIDMGEQPVEFQGERKLTPKLMLSWELLDEDTQREDGTPMTVHKRYTASLHEKSRLRQDLEAWRGRSFTPEELQAFDVKKLAGAFALLGIVHQEKGETIYANVASIMKPPKGLPLPPGVNDLLTFDMADPATHDNLLALPEKVVQQIEASPTWGKAHPAHASTSQSGAGFPDLDDDVAF